MVIQRRTKSVEESERVVKIEKSQKAVKETIDEITLDVRPKWS